MDKIRQYAEHLVILELMKARLKGFQNVSSDSETDFIIKTRAENYYEILLQTIDLEKNRSIKIPKTELGSELKDKHYIALVLFMKKMEPAVYLIPFKVFDNPNQIFINNDIGGRFNHFSNWEIKIFTKAIPELSKFALISMVSHLV